MWRVSGALFAGAAMLIAACASTETPKVAQPYPTDPAGVARSTAPSTDAPTGRAENRAHAANNAVDTRPPDERAFDDAEKKARETGKDHPLREFIQNFPESPFTGRAGELADEIQYAPVRRDNLVKGYSAFIAAYPNNRFREEARIRAEEVLFGPFAAIGTIDAYNNFLQSFPGSRFAKVAQAAVEDIVFEGVKEANTLIGYAEFIRQYPQSGRMPEAIQAKEDLEFAPYKTKDSEVGYKEFLWEYPVNHNRDDARKRHDELRDSRIKNEADKICNEAKNSGTYSCDFVSYSDGTLHVKIIKLGEVAQGQTLLMGGPGYLEEMERRYRNWKGETIKRFLLILEVVSVTVE